MSDNQFDFGPAAKQIESLKGAANGLASLDSNGLVPSSQLPGATQSVAGLMSAADKTKLDGIATGATANVVSDSLSDTSTTNALSAAKGKALNDSVTALNTQIATHKATVTGETGYTVEINEIYYRGNESHCNGTTRIRGNFGTGWTQTIATIDKKPSAEVIVPAINVTDGTFIGMATIRADGTIGLYNSTGTAYTNKAIGFTASW